MNARKILMVLGIAAVALALIAMGASGNNNNNNSSVTSTFAQGEQKFTAKLTGKDEVPPKDTKANGTAEFNLSADGKMMTYMVNVMNIDSDNGTHS
jgi:CHRD domain